MRSISPALPDGLRADAIPARTRKSPETTAYRLRRAAGPPGAAERGAGRAGIAREDRERVCRPEERPWTVKPSGDPAERVFRGTAENQLPDARWPKIMAGMDH